MSEQVLCVAPSAVCECYCVQDTFETVEDARAAIPEMLERAEVQRMLQLDTPKNRKGGYIVLPRDPSDSDAFRCIFMKLLRSDTGWCVESDLVPTDYPEKTMAVRRVLNDSVKRGLLVRTRSNHGYSYTLANWTKEGIND